MESTLQIMPVQRTSRNFGEYAEEAVIIEEPIIKQKRPLFIEANTIEASLEHLRNDCIIPVFAKDNGMNKHPDLKKTSVSILTTKITMRC